MIGDAAHGMLQFLAEGAAMVTEDARALVECVTKLGSEGGVADAMYHYERSRKLKCKLDATASPYTCLTARNKNIPDRKLAWKSLPTDQDIDCGPLLDPEITSWLDGHDTIKHAHCVLSTTQRTD